MIPYQKWQNLRVTEVNFTSGNLDPKRKIKESTKPKVEITFLENKMSWGLILLNITKNFTKLKKKNTFNLLFKFIAERGTKPSNFFLKFIYSLKLFFLFNYLCLENKSQSLVKPILTCVKIKYIH